MKRGIDVSHWNNLADIWETDNDFMFAKLTEGKTMKDWTAYQYYTYADALKMPFGVYHYAHPENNSASEEFEHFKNYYLKFKNDNLMIALDIEGKALYLDQDKLDQWAYDWLNMAQLLTQNKVYLYVQQSACKMFDKCKIHELWVARYRAESKGYGDVTPWNTASMWQYDSKLVDKNIMY